MKVTKLILPVLAVMFALSLRAQTPSDLASSFDATAEDWLASDAGVTLTWQATGGTPDGYLQATGPAGTNAWYFVSPPSWSGDWSGYLELKFDFSIPSRHYPDADRAGMVVIVGTNGQQMTWTGSTPLWTWTHYEVDLSPAAFGVDQATFDGIMTNVAELRILGEFSTATETVGLDNVLVTATPTAAHTTDLVSRFSDGTIEGWRPVDDVTLSASQLGQPSFGLMADDWMDGRLYKVATPLTWAGDWRQYKQLNFDMHWTGQAASHDNVELVRIFGANGHTLSWSSSITGGVWTHRSIPLTPDSFGVSQAELDGVLEHVSEMWIFGEFGDGDDITYLDNIILSTSTNNAPVRRTQNLVSRFDASNEGWLGFDYCTLTWGASDGVSGGGVRSVDTGNGTARFQSPDDWSGDWRDFKALRFMLRCNVSARAEYDTTIWITTWNGSNLSLTLPKPYGSWTPYTVDLTPETFGVTTNEFDAIMSDVACLWIQSDLVGGTGAADTTKLDNVMLLTESGAGIPADHLAEFETDNENWRYGAWNTSTEDWSFSGQAPHEATGGNPGGFLQNTDTGDWTYWFTPETWAGDWRGLQSVSFDFKIIYGTSLFDTRMISLCSPYTNLHASVSILPVPGQWMHYEFQLTPATFGVSAETFDQVMRDVVLLGIRSEWVNGSETEGLDNVRITKATDAYWTWMGEFYSGTDLTDENKSGKFADPDGDGLDNWSEYLAATVPTNHQDFLCFDQVAFTNGTCWLNFKTHTSRLYSVESATGLSSTNVWTPVTNDITGTGSAMTIPAVTGDAQRFYRLKVQLGN